MASPSRLRRVMRRSLLALLGLLAVALLVPASCRVSAIVRESEHAADLAPAEGHYVTAAVTTEALSMFVEELGPREGRPLVLIPGTMAFSGTFRPLMERVAAEGYRVIAVDLPPFGFSERPLDRDYGRRAQAERLGALLDALDVHDVVLLGHSFGAGATVETAMLRSDRVSGLVLLAGALGLDELEAGGAHLPSALRYPWLRNALVATTTTNPLTTGAVLRSMMANDDVVTDERIAVYQQPFRVEGLTPSVGDWLVSGLFADERGADSADLSAYRSYGAPVLLVWGRSDEITPVAQGRALAALLPTAQLVELDGVGHIPHVEALDAVSEALLSWLRANGSHR